MHWHELQLLHLAMLQMLHLAGSQLLPLVEFMKKGGICIVDWPMSLVVVSGAGIAMHDTRIQLVELMNPAAIT